MNITGSDVERNFEGGSKIIYNGWRPNILRKNDMNMKTNNQANVSHIKSKRIHISDFLFHTSRENIISCELSTYMRKQNDNFLFREQENIDERKVLKILLHRLDDFSCTDCGRSLNRNEPLRLLYYTLRSPLYFICSECYDSRAISVGYLRKRRDRVQELVIKNVRSEAVFSEKTRLFMCYYCDQAFTSKKSQIAHLVEYHRRKTFPCRKCSREFAQITHLMKHHERWHRDMVACGECRRLFTKTYLQHHLDAAHRHFVRHQCRACADLFMSRSGLQTHVKRTHGDRRVYSSKQYLAEHIRAVHDGADGYPCGACDRAFTQSRNLKRHFDSVHRHLRNFKCDNCDKAFARRECVASHAKRSHANWQWLPSSPAFSSKDKNLSDLFTNKIISS